MRRKRLFAICYLLFVISTVKADWVNVSNEINQPNVNALTSYGNFIFAGTTTGFNNGGVYVSSNNGANWTRTLFNESLSLAASGNYLYCGYQNGLWYSTNNGVNWALSFLGQWTNAIIANGNFVYAGCFYPVLNSTNKGVWTSTNYGVNWTQTSLNNINIHALAINGSNLFAGADVYGVYLSTNTGLTWTQTSLNFTTVWSIAINGGYIFAGTGGSGVYLSTNSGTNWVQTSLNNATPRALLIYNNAIFEGGGGGVTGLNISTDNGTSWIQRNEGIGNLVIHSLCISSGYIFAGTDGTGVFRRPLSELVGIEPVSNSIPSEIGLLQNYPNPFNPITHIGFEISMLGFVSLKIFDNLGKEISTLVNEQLKPGTYEVTWDGSDYSSGVYFYQLIAGGNIIETKKMILSK